MFFQLSHYSDLALFALRFAIAAIFALHAIPKFKDGKKMAQAMGMPAGMVIMLGGIEFLSALAILTGIYIQVGALLLSAVMLGAIFFKAIKWHVPFAAHDKTGWEFDLILLAVNLFLLVSGGGGIKF